MASRCVVPVRAKASLTSGSTASRRPRSRAAASGAARRVQPRDEPGIAPGPRGPQPSRQETARTPRVVPDASRVVDRHAEPDPPRAEGVAGVELARVQRPGDPRQRSGGLDRAARRQVGPVPRDPQAHPPGGAMPSPAVVEAGQVEHRPGRPRVAREVAGAEAEHLAEDAPDPGGPGRLGHAPRQVVGRQVRPSVMVPAAPHRPEGQEQRHRHPRRAPTPADPDPGDDAREEREPGPVGRAPVHPEAIGHHPRRHGQGQREQRGDPDLRARLGLAAHPAPIPVGKATHGVDISRACANSTRRPASTVVAVETSRT